MQLSRYFMPLIGLAMLSGCSSEPEWVEVYEQCKEQVAKQSAEIKQSAADAKDSQSRAMAESMGNMAIGMAMTACEMIRTSCEQDEDGPACRAYVEQAAQQY